MLQVAVKIQSKQGTGSRALTKVFGYLKFENEVSPKIKKLVEP